VAKLITADYEQADEWTVRLCRALRETLDAERVSVWLYDAPAQTVSPYAYDTPEQPDLADLILAWARVPLEVFPAACTVLLESRPAEIRDAHNDDRLPAELAADFGLSSVHYEPLIVGRPVGMLSIEPAASARNPEIHSLVPLVAASVSRIAGRWQSDRARAEAEFLLELAEAALAEQSLGEMLGTICERVATELAAHRASIFLLEDGRMVPRMARYAEGSPDPAAWERFRRADAPLAAVEAVMHSGEPVIVDDPTSPLVAGWWAETFGVVSGIAVPIGRSPAHIGVLTLDDPAPRRFSKEDVRFAAATGAHIGAMVERTRASEKRTSHLRTATAIRRLLEEGSRSLSVEDAADVLVRVTREALGTEHAVLLLIDENDKIEYLATIGVPGYLEAELRDKLRGQPAGEFRGWGTASRRPKPIFIENAQTSRLIPAELAETLQLKSYAVVPLLSADQVLGLLVCGDATAPRRWSGDHKELASQLALEGALVVHNAALRATQHEQIGELARQAFHDSLTELPNRALFADRLDHALARTNRREESVAVLFLDLDEFKLVNDSFGHEAGDQLLMAVAQRLQSCLRPEDTVARLGGDEFTILLEDINDARYATLVAERVAESLGTPFVLQGQQVSVTTSIGIAVSTGREQKPSELLRNADLAMYQAKDNGRGRYEVFRPDMFPSSVEEDMKPVPEDFPGAAGAPPNAGPPPMFTDAHRRRRIRFPRR
jgi:diguanylate cyclase (GGDEF)-like protein